MELNINKICWQRSVAGIHTPAAGQADGCWHWLPRYVSSLRAPPDCATLRLTATSINLNFSTDTVNGFKSHSGTFSATIWWHLIAVLPLATLASDASSCTLLHLHQTPVTAHQDCIIQCRQHPSHSVVACSYVNRWCKCCLWTMSDNILADWKIRIWVPMLQRKEIWVLNVKTCKNPTRCWFTLISAFL